MSQVTVQEVQFLPADGKLLAGFHLDYPRAGQQLSGYALDVIGWAVGAHAPVKRIEVLHGQDVIRQADVWVPRPDVAKVFSKSPPPASLKLLLKDYVREALKSMKQLAMQSAANQPVLRLRMDNSGSQNSGTSGFHCSVGVLGLPSRFQLQIRAVLADRTATTLATISCQRSALLPAYQPRRQPIVLTCVGRSGSTWLSHLLAEHPEVVVHRRYPHEVFAATHAIRALQVLTTPTSAVRQHDLTALRKNLSTVGPIPVYCPDDDPQFHAWLRKEYVERQADFCMQLIDAMYDQIAGGQNKANARYFSEKVFWFPLLASVAAELYSESKELFLIRDFRDVSCSRQSFFADKRDRPLTIDQNLKEAQTYASSLQVNWQERKSRACLVRYEELVLDPINTLTTVFDYLGIDKSRLTIERIVSQASDGSLSKHVTSPDVKQSIGRWRRDLTPELQAQANRELHESLEAFGYKAA